MPLDADANRTINKLSEIQNRIKSRVDQVRKAKNKEASLRMRMEKINNSIAKKEKELKSFDQQIKQTERQIGSYSRELTKLTADFKGNRARLKKMIREFYKRQYGGNALILVSATDYQDLIKKSKYISMVTQYEADIVNGYGEEIKKITAQKKKLVELQNKIGQKKALARKKHNALEKDRKKKDDLLAIVKSRRIAYEKNIRELEASSKKLQDMIRKLEAKSIPRAILGKGFRSLKGNMAWPVNGKIVVPYGNYRDPLFKIPVFKKGIEIAARPGDTLKAVAGGRVVYASDFKAYGMLLIIDHGNGYHSLYRNLSEVLLEKGDLLIKGTDIGRVSRTNDPESATLYFEIRHRGKPVNPTDWLVKKI